MNRQPWREPRPGAPRRGRWAWTEIALLQDWYGLRDIESIARDLARKPESVRRQAEIVCRRPARTGPWTAVEIAELKRYLGLSGPDVIACVLGREVEEVRAQIFELGRIRRDDPWSREEKQELKRLYGSRSDEDLALILSRSVESVRALAKELRLGKDKGFLKRAGAKLRTRMPRWSEAALQELRERYPREANIDIATAMGRSIKSVISKAHQLGLKKEKQRLSEMGRENARQRFH